jgi:hypothetical protein
MPEIALNPPPFKGAGGGGKKLTVEICDRIIQMCENKHCA